MLFAGRGPTKDGQVRNQSFHGPINYAVWGPTMLTEDAGSTSIRGLSCIMLRSALAEPVRRPSPPRRRHFSRNLPRPLRHNPHSVQTTTLLMDVGERQDDNKGQNCPDEQDDKVHGHECQDPFSERSGA